MSKRERWFRDIYCDAVWESELLDCAAKAVAETYARHARDTCGEKNASADLAWATYPRLMEKAGFTRRANVSAAVRRLVDGGWLLVVDQTPRRPTLYRLTVPASSTPGTTEGQNASSAVGTTVVPLSEPRSSAFEILSPFGSSTGGTQPLEELPLEEPPLLQEDSACASSSSSAKPPRTKKTNDEAREQKIQQRKAREAATARTEIVRRTDATDDEAREIIEELAVGADKPIGNIAAFIDGCPDEDIEGHLETIREANGEIARTADLVTSHLAEQFPHLNARNLAGINAAYVGALKAGHNHSGAVTVVNRVIDLNPPKNRTAQTFIDALTDLRSRTP